MYMFAKHLHLTAVVLSILLFLFRFGLLTAGSSMLPNKWLKITPHVVDTLLLASAVWLCVILQLNPLDHSWLLQKIVAVFAYIGVGFYVLKRAETAAGRWIGLFVALGLLAFAAHSVMSRQGLF